MLRTDLQELCLDIKSQSFNSPIREFLSEAIEPPAPSAVDVAVNNLQALDALTDQEELTPLGRLLATLPIHPSLGKMIVLGIIFRCLDPMLILGAAATVGELFNSPPLARQQAREAKLSFVEGSGSDHMAIINAVRQMRLVRSQSNVHSMRDFGRQNFIHGNTFEYLDATATQVEAILVEEGLIAFTPPHARLRNELGDPGLNENSQSVPLIKALVLGGLHPNLAVNQGGRRFRAPSEALCIVHPSSINAPIRKAPDAPTGIERGDVISFTSMVKQTDGGGFLLRETSISTPLMAVLFGGNLSRRGNVLELDKWLPFYVKSWDRSAAELIYKFRQAMERLYITTFQDLSVKRQERMKELEVPSLADEQVRTIFAQGLVEILKRDVRANDAVAQKGLGARSAAVEGFHELFEEIWKPKTKSAPQRREIPNGVFGGPRESKY